MVSISANIGGERNKVKLIINNYTFWLSLEGFNELINQTDTVKKQFKKEECLKKIKEIAGKCKRNLSILQNLCGDGLSPDFREVFHTARTQLECTINNLNFVLTSQKEEGQ